MKKSILYLIGILVFLSAGAQDTQEPNNFWRVVIERKDSTKVPFLLERKQEHGKTVLYVMNGPERIRITNVRMTGDSLFFGMPAFESSFRAQIMGNGDLKGNYIKGTAGATQYWPMYGYAKEKDRFISDRILSENNISGKWDVSIRRANGTIRKAVAIFEQQGNNLTGSFLTPSADYRYLAGIVSGDSLRLSAFDGDNIHLFEAKIDQANRISDGIFYNGYTGKEIWSAIKNNSVSLPATEDPTRLRDGDKKLNFTFRDLYGKSISINDEKYKNKVVVIQLMGSWCANCLDETRFLADYYAKNRSQDIEIIALAYELTTDTARSRKSLAKFQKLFNVLYPMLITGVAAGDEKKTEKTLPQLTEIRSFPTTIFIDKKGYVREIHSNFYGPASGKYFTESKNKFYETVDRLSKE